MVMVKVFTTDNNGKVGFTKEELETLLNEVWQDGYNSNKSSWWWTSPTTTTPYYPTITCKKSDISTGG